MWLGLGLWLGSCVPPTLTLTPPAHPHPHPNHPNNPNQVARTATPEPELKKATEAQAAADPEMMPYFFLQHDDYITLKERTAAHVLAGEIRVRARLGLAPERTC